MCGGTRNQHCFRYLPANDTWVVSGSLGHSWGHSYSSGYTYHNELGLVITGGMHHTANVINIFDNMTIQVSTCIKTIQKYEKEELQH